MTRGSGAAVALGHGALALEIPAEIFMQVVARQHPDLFVDLVAVLDEEFWEDLFYRYGGRGNWLWGQWDAVRSQLRFQEHGKTPCWCGSGRAYWHCCAERDEAFGEQMATEEREREWALNPESIPWWHPDSGVDHYTRSGYEMHYIDSDHPFALTPPEWRENSPPEDATRRKRRKSSRRVSRK
jgi:hypothetical protein